MRIADLGTPALLLDRGKLDANLARMRTQLAPFDVQLRPHVKTTKSVEATRRIFGGAAGPITVSTLREAEVFFEAGFDDILYAVGIVPAKLPAVFALRRRGAAVAVILDSAAVAQQIVAACHAANARLEVLIEVDSDGHRSGLRAESEELVEAGRILAAAGLLGGVLTHAGGSYACQGAAALVAHAQLERTAIVTAASRLRAAGLPCPVVSLGSTPTASFGRDFTGVTEVRAGVYVLQDLVMAGIGVCTPADIAISVLTSVIGHHETGSRVVIDAGWMALSRDRGTAAQAVDQGYGLVCDIDGNVLEDLIVAGANQEHGLVARRDGGKFDLQRFPVGSRLRILPNHACATGAQHDDYAVTDDNETIAARWPRFRGW